MRTFIPLIFLSSILLLLSGCAAMSDKVRDRFTPVPPKVQAFDGDVRTVYTAAKAAFKRLDFALTDSSGAPSSLEASSRILTSVALGDSRQTVVSLHFHEVEAGKTEVEMRVSLEVENAAQGGHTAQPKREDVLFETYFTTLQQVLQERGTPGQ